MPARTPDVNTASLRVTVVGRAPGNAAAGLGRWLTTAAPDSATGEVAIALVSDARMRRLNRTFRHVDAPTDVLSFPADPRTNGPLDRTNGPPDRTIGPGTRDPGLFLGDLAIALGVAARQARECGHPLRTELRILALHGLLHLLGYDHERDRGTMRRLEERLRRHAGLPGGLIARTPSTPR
jgi:probable rRNA maturation factor